MKRHCAHYDVIVMILLRSRYVICLSIEVIIIVNETFPNIETSDKRWRSPIQFSINHSLGPSICRSIDLHNSNISRHRSPVVPQPHRNFVGQRTNSQSYMYMSIMHVYLPSLVQIEAGRLVSAKPLSELMLGYF